MGSSTASRAARQTFALLNDEPVEAAAEDLLATGRAARQLAGLLLASRTSTPFTLAVDAGWGMGKSSLMRLVQAELETSAEVGTLWYNAWTSTGADALEGLIKSVLMRFDRRLLRRTLHHMSEQRALLRVLRATTVLAAGPLGAAGLVSELWRGFSADPQARNEMRDSIRELAQQWSESARYSPRRLLVVFIDDLDRCSAETVLAVCEAVKVYLDVPGLAFVIGCDRSVLGPTGLLRDLTPAGAAFLEKIFHTSYRIPVADERDIRGYIDACARATGAETLLDERLATLLAERSSRNPRRIKRLVNGFVLEATLNPMWADHPPEAVIRTLLLQYFYADFYRMMTGPPGADSGDVITEFRTYRRVRALLRAPDALPEQDREAVVGFLRDHDVTERELTDPVRALRQLERQLPSGFPEMVTDQGFTSLIDGLMELPRAGEMVRRLREGAAVPAPALAAPAATGAFPALDGVAILWVDDFPANNQDLIALFEAEGAVVELATGDEAADAVIDVRPPTLILSDIARGRNAHAGFDYVGKLREDNRFTGPVAFYANRITPDRVARGQELGATVTASPADVDRFVRTVAARSRSLRPPTD